ncbi:GntR family transcriptional regulator [Mogibacterium timidum]|uniref:GntR family transcriptional regulator n=1 Tax=Mogibacterium timidum TaxID=35519 RepID=UPI00248C2B49|nr:GntR family transcriptional regulator [Mogibacterium timidum]
MMTNPGIESNQPLSNTLFVQIQKDILSGKLPANSKLTEQAVCKQYDVSRTPVREAFRQLESDGLIENIPNRGAYVIGLSSRDISDLFDLRRTFEVKAVEWAIERMDDSEIDTLRENIEFMEFYTLKADVEKVLQFNSAFHNIIYKGTKNRMLYQTLSSYQTYLKHSAPAKTFNDGYLRIILDEHKTIFEAFETKNPAAGKNAMDYHMQQSKLRRMSHLF